MHLLKQLVRQGLLKNEDLDAIVSMHAHNHSKPLHELLIEKGFVREEELLPVLAAEFGMELVDVTKVTIDPETLKSMPLKLVHRRTLMPLQRDNGTLIVATGDPFDVH